MLKRYPMVFSNVAAQCFEEVKLILGQWPALEYKISVLKLLLVLKEVEI